MFSKTFSILILFLLIFSFSANSQDFTIYRQFPQTVKSGEFATIEIVVQNLASVEKTFSIEERVPAAETSPECEERDELNNCILRFSLTIPANSTSSVSYEARFDAGLVKYEFAEARVTDGISTVLSNRDRIFIGCNENSQCETGENYVTCPDDCSSGSADDFCDQERDGICDPDCSRNQDFDCHCGNKRCEISYGENRDNCQSDCVGSEKISSNNYYILLVPIIIILATIIYMVRRNA